MHICKAVFLSKFYWHIIIVTDMQTDLLPNPALDVCMQGSYLQGYIVKFIVSDIKETL